MSIVGTPERVTQNRIIKLFRDELGYRTLGDWTDRPDNSNIEELLLSAYLRKAGHSSEQISRAIAQIALYDLPDDYFTTFVPKVTALTLEDLTRAAHTHIDPSRFLTVIVGDRDKMGAMAELGLGEPMVVEAS